MQLPTPQEFEEMKSSLKFKADELRKAETTAQGLMKERSRIYEDLQVRFLIKLLSFYISNFISILISPLFWQIDSP